MEKKNVAIFCAFFMMITLSCSVVVQAQESQTTKLEPDVTAEDIYNESIDIPEEVKEILRKQDQENARLTEKREVNAISPVNCTDYYKFQSVQVSIGADKDVYNPGDAIQFNGTVTNDNTYPIVDGNVFVRFSRKNNNYVTEGNYVVDEFIVKENIAIKSKESMPVKFEWYIPQDITDGSYRIDYFFSVGKQFNLGGLPFTNEVVIGGTEFTVTSDQKGFFSFDRSSTTVNGQKYNHIGTWPNIDLGEEVVVDQPLLNTLSDAQEADVTYELYYWDSLNKDDLIDTKKEHISIASQETKKLQYIIPSMDAAVYYLVITARAGEQKTIVNIRITSPQSYMRLNYPAITKFPVKEGEQFTLFSCFHNGSSTSARGKVEVTLTDKDKKDVGAFVYEGSITSGMMAQKSDIVAQKDYDHLILTAKVYDSENAVVDEYEVTYDCAQFDVCGKNESVQGFTNNIFSVKMIALIITVIITMIAFGTIIVKLRRNK